MWSYNSLSKKATVLVRKGLEHENPTSFEVPFWCILSLELLARATLSKINPALLADPKEGNNILFACGYPKDKSPISIPAKTVYHRCTEICPKFTQDEYNRCMIWLNHRNTELHTGALPLSSLKTSEWMPEFFRIVKILLDFNNETLENFVGLNNIDSVNKMIQATIKNKKNEVAQYIKNAQQQFDALDIEVKLNRIKNGKENLHKDWYARRRGQEIKCPSCQGSALISGELIRSTTPKDDNGDFIQEDVMLPVKLQCYCCSLLLDGHEYLHAIGMGNQYTIKDYLDPKDYYGIEFDSSDIAELEYGND